MSTALLRPWEDDYLPGSCTGPTLKIFLEGPEAEVVSESVGCFELYLELLFLYIVLVGTNVLLVTSLKLHGDFHGG